MEITQANELRAVSRFWKREYVESLGTERAYAALRARLTSPFERGMDSLGARTTDVANDAHSSTLNLAGGTCPFRSWFSRLRNVGPRRAGRSNRGPRPPTFHASSQGLQKPRVTGLVATLHTIAAGHSDTGPGRHAMYSYTATGELPGQAPARSQVEFVIIPFRSLL